MAHLVSAPADEGVSTDELCGVAGISPGALPKAMSTLETLGIARNDVAMTVFVHVGVASSSAQRLAQASALEGDLIALMQELAPDMDDRTPVPLNLSETCQRLRDKNHSDVRPDAVDRLVRGIAQDGRSQDGGRGNISLRRVSRNTLMVTLVRPWKTVRATANLRWQAAELLLNYLTGRLDKGVRGKDLQVETTVGDLLAQLNQDAILKNSGIGDMTKLMERALMWLHEQGVVTLGKGLTVFRSAMTVYLDPAGGAVYPGAFRAAGIPLRRADTPDPCHGDLCRNRAAGDERCVTPVGGLLPAQQGAIHEAVDAGPGPRGPTADHQRLLGGDRREVGQQGPAGDRDR